MATSNYTKMLKAKLWFWRILSWICLFLPLIIYVIIGLVNDNVLTASKITLVGMLFLALILTLINVVAQKNLRCPIWVLLLGIYVAIKNWLLPLIIILAITSVLDDLVFTPLIHYYYTQTVSSKMLDNRQEAEKNDGTNQEN